MAVTLRDYNELAVKGARGVLLEVDLLAGEYTGTGKSHRTQTVQDVRARKARGCDLAFKLHTGVTVDGVLPGGAKDSAEVLVATIVPFIVMKGMALHDRVKEKDAYDIYYCVKNYSGGIDRLGEEFRPFLANKLVKEGLKKIRAKFVSPEHAGPAMVADFMEVGGTEERELAKRDAFERISAFFRETGQ